MDEITPRQRAAVLKARAGADTMEAGRLARDESIREAALAGLSERKIAEAIGRKGDGKWIVTPSTIHRIATTARPKADEA